MISVTTLYCGQPLSSHQLRYRHRGSGAGPVVVFNCTERCNLACRHCYSGSTARPAAGELTTAEALAVLDDLAGMKCPAVLFSGGEPLLRADLPELLARCKALNLRATISTNGTLITPAAAAMLAEAGVVYVGISIDGLAETHDRFRRVAGSFDQAMTGIANCRQTGIKVGLRMTLNKSNAAQIDQTFELVRRQGIQRVCFYHLVYTGRGQALRADDLDAPTRRNVMDQIIDQAAWHGQDAHATRRRDAYDTLEVLTVDNHADGPFVYLRLVREDPAKAEAAMELLRANGGNASGDRLGCIRPNGDVLPDQFWRHRIVGNVRRRPFSQIWRDESIELLRLLRQRHRPLTGRCRHCRFLDVCNGNFRARAEAATGDIWGDDPACYLTEEEITERS